MQKPVSRPLHLAQLNRQLSHSQSTDRISPYVVKKRQYYKTTRARRALYYSDHVRLWFNDRGKTQDEHRRSVQKTSVTTTMPTPTTAVTTTTMTTTTTSTSTAMPTTTMTSSEAAMTATTTMTTSSEAARTTMTSTAVAMTTTTTSSAAAVTTTMSSAAAATTSTATAMAADKATMSTAAAVPSATNLITINGPSPIVIWVEIELRRLDDPRRRFTVTRSQGIQTSPPAATTSSGTQTSPTPATSTPPRPKSVVVVSIAPSPRSPRPNTPGRSLHTQKRENKRKKKDKLIHNLFGN
ncbi:cell wall protein DAN4-like [Solenopsis invicta]|uniref:cell wall protein DAN4-like n=1 Tax=Solenopsis invicta TaxID=13686 RepID=UPI00193DC120|nr:cell wall protein DAN4-like [Solenopsis invicta]